jgi:hypothetical protein
MLKSQERENSSKQWTCKTAKKILTLVSHSQQQRQQQQQQQQQQP